MGWSVQLDPGGFVKITPVVTIVWRLWAAPLLSAIFLLYMIPFLADIIIVTYEDSYK